LPARYRQPEISADERQEVEAERPPAPCHLFLPIGQYAVDSGRHAHRIGPGEGFAFWAFSLTVPMRPIKYHKNAADIAKRIKELPDHVLSCVVGRFRAIVLALRAGAGSFTEQVSATVELCVIDSTIIIDIGHALIGKYLKAVVRLD